MIGREDWETGDLLGQVCESMEELTKDVEEGRESGGVRQTHTKPPSPSEANPSHQPFTITLGGRGRKAREKSEGGELGAFPSEEQKKRGMNEREENIEGGEEGETGDQTRDAPQGAQDERGRTVRTTHPEREEERD